MRPFFKRLIAKKSQSDILKFFEQCRKNFTLNKSDHENPTEELGKLRKDFYRGLISDLLISRLYSSSQVVYQELLTSEKNDIGNEEYILGMKIFTSQRNIERYEEIYNLVLASEESVG